MPHVRLKTSLRADVHLAPCMNKKCKRKLQRLVAGLKANNLTCVSRTEYPDCGKYLTWFEQAFKKCTFTIIHRCPDLWGKIKSFESVFSEEMKVRTVEIHDPMLEMDPETTSEEERKLFNDFFDQRMTCDVIDEEDLNEFGIRVYEDLEGYREEEPTSTTEEQLPSFVTESSSVPSPLRSAPQRQAPVKESSTPVLTAQVVPEVSFSGIRQGKADCPEEDTKEADIFEAYTDVFGEKNLPQMFVRKSCLELSGHEEFSYANPEDYLQMRTKIDENKNSLTAIMTTKYIMHQVLPTMYSQHNLMGLACIATCEVHVLRDRALTLLEMAFLQYIRSGERMLNFDDLENIGGLLHTALTDFRNKHRLDNLNQALLSTICRMSNVYLMLMCEIVSLSTESSNNKDKCANFFNTKKGQLLALKTTSDVNRDLKNVDDFVEAVDHSSCVLVRQNSNLFLGEKPSKPKHLLKEMFPVQITVVFEALKKTFNSWDPFIIDFLKGYLESKSKSGVVKKKPLEVPAACNYMLLQGLTHFLMYQSRHVTIRKINSLYEHVMTVIEILLDHPDNKARADSFYLRLLCDNKPLVQELILDKVKAMPGLKRELLEEIKHLLLPLLIVEETNQPHQDSKLQGAWSITSGKFDNTRVLIHVNQLPETFPRQENGQSPKTYHNFPLTELQRLKQLQHSNIIQMFVFQENSVLQLYVCEDYRRMNLQTALVKHSLDKSFFPRPRLFQYLIEGCSAVAYCHSKNFVHCNLTAASLCLSGEHVKLCGFQLCQETSSGKYISHNNTGIPTRWSALESLSSSEYSQASDCWMLGHLIYEVLTHGLLPYGHETDIQGLVKKICCKEIALSQERCFEKETWNLILDCTKPDSTYRPSVNTIIHVLKKVADETEGHASELYPVLTDKYRRPSTDYEVGMNRPPDFYIPTVVPIKKDIVSVSDRISRCTLEDQYVFTEKLLHKWPSDMIVKIQLGEVKEVLPVVLVYENEREFPHVEIKIPSSCLGPMSNVTSDLKMGQELGPYVYCFLLVARLLVKLHTLSWVIGDLCPGNTYVESLPSEEVKVYFTSLTHLNYSRSYTEGNIPEDKNVPEDSEVSDRAAPEVKRGGLFSPASDVYCFGIFMRDVLAVHDKAKDKLNDRTDNSLGGAQVEFDQTKEADPNSGIESLQDLIKQCDSFTSRDRPTAEVIVTTLQQVLTEELSYNVPEASPRETPESDV
ncbi:uncharacterized protein LOC101857336 isoform X1 [Aplysia californica]|uniref:Uncharacterized protein LOC101857336 isoform X1 n=1 Tax=Aplysia californica TaxID=6500 RepID=A0ABM0JP85_APLCA|nr:uncharacterized protein LOC101857336 isoform X1 [Aplysia californica]